jgi:hypothetical protein
MTDWGPGFWPLDETSGSTAHDSFGLHNGTLSATSHIDYRVSAPSASTYGMKFNRYNNGNPWYAGPWSAPGMSVVGTNGGWGNFNGLQPFTIAFKVKWFAPVFSFGSIIAVSGLSNLFNHNYAKCGWLTNQGQDPYTLLFSRNGGTTYCSGTVDFPADVDYVTWDNWTGVYKEPIKVAVWAQVVLRFTGTRKSIWIDGAKVAEDTADDTYSIPLIPGPTLTWNQVNDASFSELALWHRALSDAEITT